VTLSVFHEQWWLDAVAPGWQEVQVEENGRAVARMPFVRREMFGFTLLVAPPLSNRLGPSCDLPEGRTEARLRRFDHLVDELLDRLPQADLVRQVLHPDVLSWLPFHRRGFRVEPQVSYVLDRVSDLDVVFAGVSGQTRRVIKKAGTQLAVERDVTAERLRPMVDATFDRQGMSTPYRPEVLDRLVRAFTDRDRGTVLTAVDASGAVHASLFCVWDDRRAWYLGGGGDPRLRSSGAGSLLMWELIKEAAGHVDRFDFEGSMLPSVERYFRNFGGRQETCYLVSRTSRRFAAPWALAQWQRGLARRAAAEGGGEGRGQTRGRAAGLLAQGVAAVERRRRTGRR